jgi:hypothetical protein
MARLRGGGLSFVGDGGFRGGCLVLAFGFVTAVEESHRLGINPGGDVQGSLPDQGVAKRISGKWKHRLLSSEEIAAMDEEIGV